MMPFSELPFQIFFKGAMMGHLTGSGSLTCQECFRAQAQLLRQKATRVPYRSSSLTQAGTAATF